MTTNFTPSHVPSNDHRHTNQCWWNPDEAKWICGPVAATGTTDERVDVRDMLVVHTALLREFRLAPDAVARVREGDRKHAKVIDRHLTLLCDLLHHHHTGEDELLWPLLRDRLPSRSLALVDVVEAQHTGIDDALESVRSARQDWLENVDAATREELMRTLQTLHRLLSEHLEAEERTVLPLAATTVSVSEWRAIGAAGAASVSPKFLPLVFGMFAYEGDPEVLADMLSAAPAVPRRVVPLIAPRLYCRHAKKLYGTARP